MRTVLAQDERIFGMALAFEPRQFDADREDFCLYVFRGPDGDRKEAAACRRTTSRCIASGIGTRNRCGNSVRCGASPTSIPAAATFRWSPIRRRSAAADQFVGVLTLDLSVQYFDVLRAMAQGVELGREAVTAS